MSIKRHLSGIAAMVALLGGTAAVYPAIAQDSPSSFPDVSPDYWASPFIKALRQADIITGYPDGQYRPRKAIDRDEFSAMLSQAFDREQVQSIPSGSIFADVPEGYWAEIPIEEAYESNFLDAEIEEDFNPRQRVTKVAALVALSNGIEELKPAPIKSADTQQVTIALPLGASFLMGLFAPPQKAESPEQTDESPRAIARNYYEDAEEIPEFALEEVVEMTRAGIVVNYPDANLLEPNEPLSRGAAAAIVHQTLVRLDRLPPLPQQQSVNKYVVNSSSSQE